MAAVPVVISGVLYPKNKKDPPVAATLFGNAWIAGLEVGGGPIEPPPDIQPEPPLVIWGGGNEPFPTPPIYFPDPIPPEPPQLVKPPHEGWNWSAAKSGWYYLYIPGPGEVGPKRK